MGKPKKLGASSDAVDMKPLSLDLELPKVEMPEMPEMPEISFPALDMQSSLDLPGDVSLSPAAAGALAILGLIAVMSASGSADDEGGAGSSPRKKRRRKKAPPLAIPYDAASRLAYDAWCAANDQNSNEDAYDYFKELYEAQAVAEATSKKMQRDLDAFQNQPKPEMPERSIYAKAFFFARSDRKK